MTSKLRIEYTVKWYRKIQQNLSATIKSTNFNKVSLLELFYDRSSTLPSLENLPLVELLAAEVAL